MTQSFPKSLSFPVPTCVYSYVYSSGMTMNVFGKVIWMLCLYVWMVKLFCILLFLCIPIVSFILIHIFPISYCSPFLLLIFSLFYLCIGISGVYIWFIHLYHHLSFLFLYHLYLYSFFFLILFLLNIAIFYFIILWFRNWQLFVFL